MNKIECDEEETHHKSVWAITELATAKFGTVHIYNCSGISNSKLSGTLYKCGTYFVDCLNLYKTGKSKGILLQFIYIFHWFGLGYIFVPGWFMFLKERSNSFLFVTFVYWL